MDKQGPLTTSRREYLINSTSVPTPWERLTHVTIIYCARVNNLKQRSCIRKNLNTIGIYSHRVNMDE